MSLLYRLAFFHVALIFSGAAYSSSCHHIAYLLESETQKQLLADISTPEVRLSDYKTAIECYPERGDLIIAGLVLAIEMQNWDVVDQFYKSFLDRSPPDHLKTFVHQKIFGASQSDVIDKPSMRVRVGYSSNPYKRPNDRDVPVMFSGKDLILQLDQTSLAEGSGFFGIGLSDAIDADKGKLTWAIEATKFKRSLKDRLVMAGLYQVKPLDDSSILIDMGVLSEKSDVNYSAFFVGAEKELSKSSAIATKLGRFIFKDKSDSNFASFTLKTHQNDGDFLLNELSLDVPSQLRAGGSTIRFNTLYSTKNAWFGFSKEWDETEYSILWPNKKKNRTSVSVGYTRKLGQNVGARISTYKTYSDIPIFRGNGFLVEFIRQF